jgi:hypothetical protein
MWADGGEAALITSDRKWGPGSVELIEIKSGKLVRQTNLLEKAVALLATDFQSCNSEPFAIANHSMKTFRLSLSLRMTKNGLSTVLFGFASTALEKPTQSRYRGRDPGRLLCRLSGISRKPASFRQKSVGSFVVIIRRTNRPKSFPSVFDAGPRPLLLALEQIGFVR